MIYAILGALVVGASLGLFGSGGSILTVPVLVYLLDHAHKPAIAESLAIVGLIAMLGAVPYARARMIDWRTAVLFGLPGMVGTYAGAWISRFVPGYVQLLVFAVVMALVAVRMWKPAQEQPVDQQQKLRPQTPIAKIALEGLAVGVLTGFVGVGGGFLIVPALVLLGGLDMRRAVATSLIIITLKSAAGFWKYLDVLQHAGLSVNWETIAVFTAVGAVGSLLGRALNAKLNQAALRRGFAAFLIVMAGFILATELHALLTQPAVEAAPAALQEPAP